MLLRQFPVHVIVNPSAGKGRAAEKAPGFFSVLEQHGISFSRTVTRRAGEAEETARRLGGSGATILVLGGDGTLNEVVNGMDDVHVVLGVLPCGTGNDFAGITGIKSSGGLADALVAGRTRTVDTGRLSVTDADGAGVQRRFINMMGAGFDAAVAARMRQSRCGGGILPYLYAVFRTLGAFRAVRGSISTNGRTEETTVFLAAVGNGTSSGGGFMLTPRARPDDGLLDLCFVRSISLRRILQLLPRTLRGSHTSAPEVTYIQTPGVRFTFNDPLPVHADGEIVSVAAVAVDVAVGGAVRVFVAPESQA